MKKHYMLISVALLFSCESQDVVPVTSSLSAYNSQNNLASLPLGIAPDLKLEMDLANSQLTGLVTPQQQSLVFKLNAALIVADEVQEIRKEATTFQQEVNSANLTGTEREQLLELVVLMNATASYLERGGIEEIKIALTEDAIKHGWIPPNTDPNAIFSSCNVNVRSVMLGAVVGFFSGGVAGGYVGATAGTVVFPVIGTVTGGASGAAAGAAVGFFGGVASGIASELLGSCFRSAQYTKAVDKYISTFDSPEDFDPEKLRIIVLANGFSETE